ncbi:hypothetical protein DMENIID0001_049300 [Sergentomyia squamirostris]
MCATEDEEMRIPFKVSPLRVCVISVIICMVFVKISHCDGHLKTSDHARLAYFILKFYKSSFVEEDNMVMSPLSMRILLSSIYPSAVGSTRLEMESRIKLHKLDTMFMYRALEKEFAGEENNLQMGNRVFVNRGVWLKPIYRKHTRNFQFDEVDFGRPELAAEIINGWSEEATAGQISHVIDPTDIHDNIQMLLLNAIHFKSPWRIPFLERRTRKHLFRTLSGRIVRTDVMVQHPADLRYAESNKLQAQIVEIPYASHFVMWILLPSTQSTLGQLVQNFTVDAILEINKNLTMTKVSLELPKFSVEAQIDGKKALSEMGAPSMFTKDELDIAMGGHRFSVGEMKQHVKLEVNEEGSELGIISWMGILQRISMDFPNFHADRPFMFLILTSKSLVPIFLGHIAQPTGEVVQCTVFNSGIQYDFYDDC